MDCAHHLGSGQAQAGAEAKAEAEAGAAVAAGGAEASVAEAVTPPLGLALAAVHAVDFVGVLELLSESLCVIEYRLKGRTSDDLTLALTLTRTHPQPGP